MVEPSGQVTTSVTCVVRVNPPPDPVMVSVKVPVGVPERVLTLSVDDPPVAGFGEKLAVVAPGRPPMLRDTPLAKPFKGLMVIV